MKLSDIYTIIDSSEDYLYSLKKSQDFKYFPSKIGLTEYGKNLELGFSTFAIKILKMINKIEDYDINLWSEYINSFQSSEYNNLPMNSFVDPYLVKSYEEMTTKIRIKETTKKVLNLISSKYDTNEIKFKKSINAETKQAISTLSEIGSINKLPLEIKKTEQEIYEDLKKLNWENPWSAGGQFSTYCVYSSTQDLNYSPILQRFILELVDSETGSYYSKTPKTSREIINGAMKVISGLDWIQQEIHYPKKLIDYCLENKPILEGCDIVDYVYVLYRCSQQSNYKKKEVNDVLNETLDYLIRLYKKDEKGFSYFEGKSQTYYYGAQISIGLDCADIQSTTLCIWAIIMILNNSESLDDKYKLIKP